MIFKFRNLFETILEVIMMVLLSSLTIIVTAAVIFRYSGNSLGWADEVGEVLLAWLTYYGAALAALNREHMGFPGLIRSLKPRLRLPFVIFSEVVILAFFAVLAWKGVYVLQILKGETLVALRWVPTTVTQSVIPIGASLFILAEILNLRQTLRMAMVDGETSSDGLAPSADIGLDSGGR